MTIVGYHALGRALFRIAQAHCRGRIIYALEGGYDPNVLAQGVRAVALSLAGEPLAADPLGPAPRPPPGAETGSWPTISGDSFVISSRSAPRPARKWRSTSRPSRPAPCTPSRRR